MKYYTPSREEFHIGFRYEAEQDPRFESWEKCVPVNGMQLSTCVKTDSDVDFRVKYLDREDIEELGWKDFKHSVDDWYSMEKSTTIRGLKFESFRLQHGYSDNTIIITGYERAQLDERGEVEGLFYGLCKNYNELERLMAQLNLLP